jgi:hypothetical protein
MKKRIVVLLTVMAAAVLVTSGVALAAPLRNTDGITISDSFSPPTPATPYPSQIVVSGLGSTITDVNLQLRGFSQTLCPDDVDVLLVGPSGANAIVMADVGGCDNPDFAVRNKTLILDDQAVNPLPDHASIKGRTFQPTDYDTSIGDIDAFPAPAPAPSGGSALSAFNGTDPNGTWSLYVVDDGPAGGAGQLRGWALQIQTAP